MGGVGGHRHHVVVWAATFPIAASKSYYYACMRPGSGYLTDALGRSGGCMRESYERCTCYEEYFRSQAWWHDRFAGVQCRHSDVSLLAGVRLRIFSCDFFWRLFFGILSSVNDASEYNSFISMPAGRGLLTFPIQPEQPLAGPYRWS